jgi:signal transduction histidine kinase
MMKGKRVLVAAVASFSLLFATLATAQEHGTKDEAKAMVDAAVAHVQKVGAEQAYKDFTSDKAAWVKKDMFVVVYDMAGNCLAQGANAKLVGKNLIEVKDPNGFKPIFELGNLAKTKGQGWLEYVWPHPQTNKLAEKLTYVRKLPNQDAWLAVGIHK